MELTKERIVKLIFSIIIICICIAGCSNKDIKPEDKYLGQIPPGDTPKLFMPEIIPVDQYAHCGIFSPDGTEYYYTTSDTNYTHFEIRTVKYKNGKWSEPQTAVFSGKDSDHAPSFSPDGRQLFFSSTRPFPNSKGKEIWQIWKVERQKNSWSNPVRLEIPGIEGYIQSHSSVTNNGTIYFHVNPDNRYKEMSLYKSDLVQGTCSPAIKLEGELRSDLKQITPFIDPNGKYLIFTMYHHKDGFGSGDLFITYRYEQNNWGTPKNLGNKINTKYEESNPFVTADGRYLFFSSRRNTNGIVPTNMAVYWVSTKSILNH